jgi:hypothetical protein
MFGHVATALADNMPATATEAMAVVPWKSIELAPALVAGSGGGRSGQSVPTSRHP